MLSFRISIRFDRIKSLKRVFQKACTASAPYSVGLRVFTLLHWRMFAGQISLVSKRRVPGGTAYHDGKPLRAPGPGKVCRRTRCRRTARNSRTDIDHGNFFARKGGLGSELRAVKADDDCLEHSMV